MKIIGRADDREFIVVAHENELANILGFRYPSASDCPNFYVGMEIVVSVLFHRIEEVRENKDTLDRLANTLRSLADLVGPLGEVFKEATGEE